MNLSAAEIAALRADVARIGFFFRLESDPVTRLWLGVGDCQPGIDTLDSTDETYTGAGELVGLPAFQQLLNGAADQVTFTLSGVSDDILAIALANAPLVATKQCNVGLGIQDANWALIAGVHWFWMGLADFVSIDQQPQPDVTQPIVRTVSLTVSSLTAARRRKGLSYYTQQDQQMRSPTDNFCERVGMYSQYAQKVWPRF